MSIQIGACGPEVGCAVDVWHPGQGRRAVLTASAASSTVLRYMEGSGIHLE